MTALLYRVGGFAARRHLVVVVIWILILAGAGTLAGTLGSHLQSSFTIPGTQSQVAIDMLAQRFPAASGASVRVIYIAETGSSVAGQTDAIGTSVAQLEQLPHVAAVSDPFADGNEAQIAADDSMAFATVQYDIPATDLTESDFAAVTGAGDVAASDALTVAFSGVADEAESAVDYTELIGLIVSLLVLIITFGSLLAAGMPLITAIIGVGISASLITIASNFFSLSSTAPLLATMLGLAVGIDYALFIVARHRSQLALGMAPRESIATAVATAGSAVVFAGLTVIIALLGLSVVGIPFLAVMGVGAALAVIVAIAVAVTLVPAVLGMFGRRLIPKTTSRTARRERGEGSRTFGSRWVQLVTARPIVTIVATVVVLLFLAVPALSLKLTLPDAGYDPPGSTTRVGYDHLAEGFGPGFNGPLLVAADISHTDVTVLEANLNALHDAFADEVGVASVSPAIPNETLDMAIVQVTPDTAPDSEATAELVKRLRDDSAEFEKTNGFGYSITGQTAMGIDISDRLEAALLPFALVVVGLCMVLLTIAFRSIAVPVTATLGFLLSVAAAFGLTTAVFEWGWLAGPLGVAKVGPVISFMPILVMAVLFGLAMDYQVFLVSRMRERFTATRDAAAAVRDGFTGGARVVTAAALIMFSVFASFVPGGAATIQPLAFALAVGVAVDAFLVRMTLIPALMAMLGDRAWALPRWLERRLPNVDIEGEAVHERLAVLSWYAAAHAPAGQQEVVQPEPPKHQPAQQDAGESLTEPLWAGDAGGAIEPTQLSPTELSPTELSPADLNPTAPLPPSIAADDLRVAGIAPVDLWVAPGDIAVLLAPPAIPAERMLQAVTGRGALEGALVVAGHPLPYDASRVRRLSALVGLGSADADERGTVDALIRRQLRLDGVRHLRAARRLVQDAVQYLAPLFGTTADAFDGRRGSADLGSDEAWLLDLALGLAGAPAVLAVDARGLEPAVLRPVVVGLAGLAADTTTIVVAAQASATDRMSDLETWRGVHLIMLNGPATAVPAPEPNGPEEDVAPDASERVFA
ncbi:MMPL family transporter [Glaciibacter superstes]|uniref:MMPL family transporter n=1 Tax=Glaciibacter superstes TaxID=501023 RepID=UPI0003B4DCBD|nr:MMPL family transporter [Glaciibacter superstes]